MAVRHRASEASDATRESEGPSEESLGGASPDDGPSDLGQDAALAGDGTRSAGALLLGGKYRLDAPIAIGGMSTIWRATHVTLGRSVAVKFIDVQTHDRAKTAERFLREARLAATIRHPNVIDVVDFGMAENGEPMMVMELLEGETLSLRIEREPRLTTGEIVQLMSQVLGALEAVHQAGILHCDMKPDNIVLGTISDASDVFAWLIDFGIAYSIDPASELRRGRFGTDLRLVTGTPEYMAPEQAEGRTDLDERADVYATSVMLYELLAGVCPFAADLPGRVLARVIDGKHTPLATLRPDVPQLAAVVELGMSRDRDARPKSARELKRLLLEAARETAEAASDATLAPNETTPTALHLPDAPVMARVSPDAPALHEAERDVQPMGDAATRRGGPPRWLIAAACWLVLLSAASVAYRFTRRTAPTFRHEESVAAQHTTAPTLVRLPDDDELLATQDNELAEAAELIEVEPLESTDPLVDETPEETPEPVAVVEAAPIEAPVEEVPVERAHRSSRRATRVEAIEALATTITPPPPVAEFVDDPGF